MQYAKIKAGGDSINEPVNKIQEEFRDGDFNVIVKKDRSLLLEEFLEYRSVFVEVHVFAQEILQAASTATA